MGQLKAYDYVIVGGGTSGAVLAARLAEDPFVSVCILEAGITDENDLRILNLKNWPNLLETELDFKYEIENQTRGNGRIRHSRGKMLGGCSSHNSAIAFRAPAVDMKIWEEQGATGWGPEGTAPYFNRVFDKVQLETVEPLNECGVAFIDAAKQAGFPEVKFNSKEFKEGVGWFQLNKKGELRQSSSVAYLHPLFKSRASNLEVMTETFVSRILLNSNYVAIGVETSRGNIMAKREIIVCAGAFNSPKLLLHSGIGPADHLREMSIPIQVDLPGVGENLLDHPEGIVIWEASRLVPEVSTQFWEAGLFVRTQPHLEWPDLMFHFGTVPFDMHTLAYGCPTALAGFSMTPNVARAKSQGTVRLRSSDPLESPRIDPAYFTDPEGHDERVMIAGIHWARKIAAQPALRSWIKQELAPGLSVQTDAELSEYARKTANTVYHPAGTCKMGSLLDSKTVVDSKLRVRGVQGLRVADASIFPTMIGVNPCLTCMMIGEKAADIIKQRD